MRFYLAGIIVSVLFLIFLLVLGWKKIFRLKRSQIRQEAMKEKAVQAIQRKNMFLSNMSHGTYAAECHCRILGGTDG